MHFWSSSGNLFQVYVVCLSGMIYFGIYWTNIPRPMIGQYGTADITLTSNVLSTVDSTNTQSGQYGWVVYLYRINRDTANILRIQYIHVVQYAIYGTWWHNMLSIIDSNITQWFNLLSTLDSTNPQCSNILSMVQYAVYGRQYNSQRSNTLSTVDSTNTHWSNMLVYGR